MVATFAARSSALSRGIPQVPAETGVAAKAGRRRKHRTVQATSRRASRLRGVSRTRCYLYCYRCCYLQPRLGSPSPSRAMRRSPNGSRLHRRVAPSGFGCEARLPEDRFRPRSRGGCRLAARGGRVSHDSTGRTRCAARTSRSARRSREAATRGLTAKKKRGPREREPRLRLRRNDPPGCRGSEGGFSGDGGQRGQPCRGGRARPGSARSSARRRG